MIISLVTCTWNRAEQLKRGILTVIAQEIPPHEIVVVDDGSTDNTRDVCMFLADKAKERDIEFKYIYLDHPEARISSIPRNVGFKNSTGEIVLFTESEMLHVGPTVKKCVDIVTNEEHVPVATQIYTMGRRIWEKLPDRFYSNPQLIISHPYAMVVAGNMQNTNAPDADWGITGSNNCWAGCLFALKREWFEELGGFDESFEGFGYDDWDLFERLNLYGKPAQPHNEITVIHQWHEKNYPYNIYEMSDKNAVQSKERIQKGIYTANEGRDWGKDV
jgi:glycosyltransferase involved in cell wall biosynthesis